VLLQAYLRRQGYTVISAYNVVYALNILEEIEPDLIISDVMMPDINGYLFLEQLKNDPRFNWIPVILVSAKAQNSERVRGISIGACAYLVKPFELTELIAQIESAIGASRQRSPSKPKKLKTRLRVATAVKLTHTEQIVAKLVAEGLSNQEISEELKISKRTTESHISHMLKKTELNNRTELSLWFIENYT
jgi:DNA-binding NarL/FixJ family response regulator